MIWNKLYGWLLGGLAAVAAIVGIYLNGRSAGKQVEQKKAMKRDLEAQRAHAETLREVTDAQIETGRMPAADVHERLRDKWTRD